MLRILIVDDSPVARGMLNEILSAVPDFEVVGSAVNGSEAVRMVEELEPDIVTMDVQMPRMNGYEATREIMTTHPTPIVVVSGSMGHEDVEKSMQSLDAGALTVVGKPPSPNSPDFEKQCVSLVNTLRMMAAVRVIRRHRPRTTEAPSEVFVAGRSSLPLASPPKLITMAASTGGPQALRDILQSLPADFPVPIVIVQHISDGFSDGLRDWLNDVSSIQVVSANGGVKVKPGVAYLAPEGAHCGIDSQGNLERIERAPLGSFRPSATVLFESASRAFGRSHLAVILTGMGNDGLDGLRSVKQTGGSVIAQNEASCVVYGMPKAAIDAGLANLILPVNAIAAELIRATKPKPP